MSIYNINFGLAAERLSPPNKRNNLLLRWLTCILYPLQWLQNLVFYNYADGSDSVQLYDASVAYTFGEIVKYQNEVFLNVNAGAPVSGASTGIPPSEDTDRWLLLLEFDLGIRERLRFNGQKIILEGLLNRIFNGTVSPSANKIIITNAVEDSLPHVFYNSDETYYSNLAPIFYNASEGKTFPEQLLLYNEAEYDTGVDFEVQVPSVFTDKQDKIQSLVDKYKIAGVRYKIAFI